jgi:hypothetical protein
MADDVRMAEVFGGNKWAVFVIIGPPNDGGRDIVEGEGRRIVALVGYSVNDNVGHMGVRSSTGQQHQHRGK